GVLAPDLLLELWIGHAEEPVVDPEDRVHPSGRDVALREERADLHEGGEVELVAPVAPRLEDTEQSGVDEVGERLVGEAPGLVRSRCALAEHRSELTGSREHLLVGRNRDVNGCVHVATSQFSVGHIVVPAAVGCKGRVRLSRTRVRNTRTAWYTMSPSRPGVEQRVEPC